MVAIIAFFLGIATCIGNGKMDSPGFATIGYGLVFSIATLIGTISIAKANNKIPNVFELDKYKYYPNNKKKLSLDETLYYMQDNIAMKVLYGVFLAIWSIFFISSVIILFILIYREAIIVGVVVVNVILIGVLLLGTGFFCLMLHLSKRNGAKYTLDQNSRIYADITVNDFWEDVEQDLYKGIRFRSPKLMLTEQFIIGTLDKARLAPVAIPVNQVKEIRYDVHYSARPTGKGYIEVKLYFDLLNGKTALLYLNYLKWEIVIQMFQYYGFNIK